MLKEKFAKEKTAFKTFEIYHEILSKDYES
jgi:hypothetical protein